MDQAKRESLQSVQWALGQAMDELAWAVAVAADLPEMPNAGDRLNKAGDVLDEVKAEVERHLGIPMLNPEGER